MTKFYSIEKQLADKKKRIDSIVARYNKAVSLQGCEEHLGLLTWQVITKRENSASIWLIKIKVTLYFR